MLGQPSTSNHGKPLIEPQIKQLTTSLDPFFHLGTIEEARPGLKENPVVVALYAI